MISLPLSEEVLSKVILPAIVAFSAWLIKNVIVGSYRAKRETALEEMRSMLIEFYCPLFYWSGVAVFDLDEEGRKVVFQKLSILMERAGYILPIKHYYLIVRLVESLSGQNTSIPDQKSILKTRDFIYSRIEVLNIVLYRQTELYNPLAWLDWTLSIKNAVRMAIEISLQLVLWVSIIAVITISYYMILGNSLATIFLVVLVLLIIASAAQRRYLFIKKMKAKLAS